MEILQPILEILLINILLSGDNALVIAMASRNLSIDLQARAIRWGTFGAIGLRILFTFLMIHLLKMPFIELVGGVLLLVVAYKLLVDNHETDHIKSGDSLQEAVSIIIFADVLMSLDNVLAIAAVAENNVLLIITGIVLSIPIILTASELILKLIKKYPVIIFFGSGLLAWTAGEMILKEGIVQHFVEHKGIPPIALLISVTFLVLLIGGIKRKWNKKGEE
ncbi:YjbE family putative metal transport protein [Oceanobacillus senegalensis]|uniref:YjbE family putative metal transport protein n=1 Tax=Oceanobacillus senegalensis TaxID=1936063 RepID=UPI000A3109C6|nr:YjbE family putative metal transport protein [Oceanobacillus senegalensis]